MHEFRHTRISIPLLSNVVHSIMHISLNQITFELLAFDVTISRNKYTDYKVFRIHIRNQIICPTKMKVICYILKLYDWLIKFNYADIDRYMKMKIKCNQISWHLVIPFLINCCNNCQIFVFTRNVYFINIWAIHRWYLSNTIFDIL